MVELQPSKLVMRVRFPSPAPLNDLLKGGEPLGAAARMPRHCNSTVTRRLLIKALVGGFAI